MIENPARVLWIGAGTKTGKTVALEQWIIQGILNGEPTAWSGSVVPKTRKTYLRIKQFLEEEIAAGNFYTNDTNGTIYGKNGACLFYSFTGEHPAPIYGDAYKRFVIDEASRQTLATYTAALTTTSPKDMNGKIRCAFNLDHGARNWAISELLRVKRLTVEERQSQSVDFMMFPTIEEPWVAPEEIERVRTSGMPTVMFDALYRAIIPESDVTLFANLDEIWTGPAPKGPERNHTYIMGVDLGRKRDWTVASVFDITARRFCAATRLYKVGWTIQYSRVSELYKTWRCSKAWVDQSGLGDPVVNELEERGMSVEGYVITEPSRKVLVEMLSAACDARSFTAPDTEEFAPHKAELGRFEISVSKSAQGKLTYRVPEGDHDDAAFSVMLAIFGGEQSNFGPPRIERVQSTSPAHEATARRGSAYQPRDFRGF